MGKSKSVTIRDVARAAGVSPGTVSRAMHDSPLVKEETRRRIMRAVEELNYVPNVAARRLSLGRSLTVTVVVPFFEHPAVVERLKGAVHALAASEYGMVLRTLTTAAEREEVIQALPRHRETDGLLLLSVDPTTEELECLRETRVPLVLVGSRRSALRAFHRVTVDDVRGARRAIRYLIGQGHERIGFIGEGESSLSLTPSRACYQGYREALEEEGVPYRTEYHVTCGHGHGEGYEAASRLLELPQRPTALFAASDTQAVGALEAARDAFLRVPKELSVVGYDDLEVAEILGLTTVRRRLFESGERAMALLLELLQAPVEAVVHEVLPTELVVRRSTATRGGY